MTGTALRRARSWGRVVVVGALLLGVFAARVVSSSRAELREGQALLAAGRVDDAIVHFRRSARWYAPGSPYHREALGHLARIGAEAEQQGDVQRALMAYRAVRAAILSTRSFYVPESARLEAANARIADLIAGLPPPPVDAGKTREAVRQEHLALLAEVPETELLWTLVLLVGFISWVAGGFIFIARAIDDENHVVSHEARRWGTVIVAGFGLFVLGMALA